MTQQHAHAEHEHEHHHGHHGHAPASPCCGHDHGHRHDPDHAHARPPAAAPLPGAAAGFHRTRLRIAAMDCPTEEALLRKLLTPLPGVAALHFDLINRVLTVDHSQPDTAPLLAAVGRAGMQAEPLPDGAATLPEAPALSQNQRRQLALAGVCAIAAEAWAYASGSDHGWVTGGLATATVLLGGLTTLRKGWIALRSLTINIHLLMTLAVTGAVLLGQWPEAAMVVWLFGLAEAIEALSLERARHAVRALGALAPETAWVREADDQWRERPTAGIAIDARLRVPPGERIPLDAVVESGQSAVNEAALTGEAMPVAKAVGDTVLAGSVNGLGALELRVTATRGHTLLDRMAQAVQQAQSQRAPTQRFIDRFARVYTPAVVLLAIALALLPPLLLGQDLTPWAYKALVLLVIACPCALVISTPVTVVSALTAAARRGMLIKGGLYLEQARQLKTVAMDKTGTLTEGRPRLVKVQALGELSEAEVLQRGASLNALSSHPIASALLDAQAAASAAPLSAVQDFEALPGRGVQGRMAGERWQLGTAALAGTPPTVAQLQAAEALQRAGHTIAWLCREGVAQGLLAVSDPLRAQSREVIEALQAQGLSVVMLSGDNRGSALHVASQLGLAEQAVQAPLLPEAKLAAIARLREQGLVAMVGDGVNDAPALARADIGIAMGAAGTAAALETADIALMQDDLRRLPELIALSRRTHQVLVQNITIALGLKAGVLALTLAGIASLWLAVFADAGAALLVVLNGLRLLRR
ncbi:cation-translocating P-type ATPase [Paucibacter sp. APW11]|uniref:P-type Zn(2+) transporter n=1 Tax=Roseateles aquae TaxID=3077235 RepID=A0ABU3PES0_9BURK|nr:cation-translocating P-type ATPase [Paucibacter sp. APW11]MDT9001046.1 cation-translocating P-type ATPase [Paucibacter sp. APW11]